MTFYPSLVAIVGDHETAIVFGLLMHSPPNVKRKGVYWLAKPRSSMCAETGITLDQYKRILPSLVKQGLIVTSRGIYGGKVTPFIRLTEKGAEAANRLVAPLTNHIDHIVQIDPLKHRSIKRIEVNIVSNQGTESGPVLVVNQDSLGGEILYKKENSGEEGVKKEIEVEVEKDQYSVICQEGKTKGWLMKASDVLKNHQAPVKGGLGAYWKSRMKTLQGGYQHPLTMKELGQLKQLSKYLGEQAKPVIDYAVNNWWKFASQAGAAAGVQWPTDPHIGFLLQHHAVAVNLLTPAVVSQVPVEVSVCPPAPPITAEAPHVLTSQELTELLESFKSP